MKASLLAPIFLVLCAIALVMVMILRVKRRWLMTAWMTILTAAALIMEIGAISMWFVEFI